MPIRSRLLLKADYGRTPSPLEAGVDGRSLRCATFGFYIRASHSLTADSDIVAMLDYKQAIDPGKK